MRSLKHIGKYLIFSGNEETIYKKINDNEFVAYYADYRGLYTYMEIYNINNYSRKNYQFIKYFEVQSVIGNNCRVFDIWKKYFGN